jgi:hypothetical protein
VRGSLLPCFCLVGQLQHLLRALQSYSRKVGFKKCAKEESISKLGKTGILKSGKIGSANPFSGSATIRKKGSIKKKTRVSSDRRRLP